MKDTHQMIASYIHNVKVMEPGKGIVGNSLLVENGKISQIDPEQQPADASRYDGRQCLVTPGLVDLHTHGIEMYLFEQSVEAMAEGLKLLSRHGVTCPTPTLYTVMKPDSLKHLEQITEAMDRSEYISTPGYHLEGPFLALPGAGGSTVPGDLGLLKELLAATRTTAMSVSPDTENIIPVIEHLVEQSVTVFLTHTRATPEQTQRAIDAGASHATHFYDVFPVPEETDLGVRPVGAVEAIFANPQVSVDFVTDGIHVHPMAVRAALAAKGFEGVCVITDSYLGATLPPGVYDTQWGYPIRISEDGSARIDDPNHRAYGALSGSCLTMDRAMNNVFSWLDAPDHEIWRMGTSSPARVIGARGKGTLQPGADADFVLWSRSGDDWKVSQTWVSGRRVYKAD